MADQNEEETVQYLPFHALNEYMRPDYRLTVVRSTLTALPKLPKSFRSNIDKLTKRVVHVPGFRDSNQAPPSMKAGPVAEAFQKYPEIVAAILSAWAESKPELRTKIYDLLKSRNWEDLLPADADRTKLPGFQVVWPKGEDFDILNDAYTQAYPGEDTTTDDVSLMVVWLSNRLPFNDPDGEEHYHDHDHDHDHDHEHHDHNHHDHAHDSAQDHAEGEHPEA
jgi:hypothetical protein